jgi:hypothetical protein
MNNKHKCLLIIITFLILSSCFVLRGCVDGGSYEEDDEKRMALIDWAYNKSLKYCVYNKYTDLRAEATEILQRRTDFPAYKALKKTLAAPLSTEFILLETYSPNTDGYSYILLIKDGPSTVTSFYDSSRQVTKSYSNIAEFNKVEDVVRSLNILFEPANLENYFVDDGTYFFYTFSLDGEIHQTLCYAPISTDIPLLSETLKRAFKKTNRFHVLTEYLQKSVKLPE